MLICAMSIKEVRLPTGSLQEGLFCNICLIQRSKYTCPRCNIRYCSVDCYKSERHLKCSEEFYKDCVIGDLKHSERSPEDKRTMIELLQRFESENTPPLLGAESATLSLEERLAGLDIDRDNGELVWQCLTEEERSEFNSMLRSGTAGELVDTYTPWWETVSKVTPVESVTADDLPPLSSLAKTVSPCVQYSVVSVLFGYAYIVRLFNGEHRELPLQATQDLLLLAAPLGQHVVFDDLHQAVQSGLSMARQSKQLFNSDTFSLFVLKDVLSIIKGGRSHDSHVTRALSDVYALIKLAHKEVKSTKKQSKESGSLRGVVKKAYFLLVWASENCLVLHSLKPLIELEIGLLEMEQESCDDKLQSHDSHMTVPPHKHSTDHKQNLIEELT